MHANMTNNPPRDPFRKQYRKLEPDEAAALNDIKDAAGRLWDLLDCQPASRGNSLAKTKLQEAVFWATWALTE